MPSHGDKKKTRIPKKKKSTPPSTGSTMPHVDLKPRTQQASATARKKAAKPGTQPTTVSTPKPVLGLPDLPSIRSTGAKQTPSARTPSTPRTPIKSATPPTDPTQRKAPTKISSTSVLKPTTPPSGSAPKQVLTRTNTTPNTRKITSPPNPSTIKKSPPPPKQPDRSGEKPSQTTTARDRGSTTIARTPPESTTQTPREQTALKRKQTDSGETPKTKQEPKRLRAVSAPKPVTVEQRPKPKLDDNAKSNAAFDAWLTRKPQHVITSRNYLKEIDKSVRENRPAAYVVNIILPHTSAGEILNVAKAIMVGTKGMNGKVAFVFGLNGKVTNKKKDKEQNEETSKLLHNAWVKAAEDVAKSPLPIAVLKDTFGTKDFPYGKMRNTVLGSDATREITATFFGAGFRPYISVQDFDKAKRTVPSGEHVFNHFSDMLAGEDPLMHADEDPEEPEKRFAIQPFSMVGGYRPDSRTTLPKTGQHTMQKAELGRYVREDMLTRSNLAKTHPLLPYGPEPNLYIDGTLLLIGDDRLVFGPGGAEFGELSRGLNLIYADELDSLAKNPIPEVSSPSDYTDLDPESFLQPDDRQTYQMELDEVQQRASVQSKAQNLQHDIRGVPFVTDFIDGSIETDLSRIAKGLGTKWDSGKGGYMKHNLPQTHVPPLNAADRIVGIKAHKKGMELPDYGQSWDFSSDPTDRRFIEGPKQYVNEVRPLPVKAETDKSRDRNRMKVTKRLRPTAPGTKQIWLPTSKERREQLGATPWKGTKEDTGETNKDGTPKYSGTGDPTVTYDRLGETVSRELPKPNARIFVGTQPSHFGFDMHSVALSSPGLDTLRKLEQLKRHVLPERTTDVRLVVTDPRGEVEPKPTPKLVVVPRSPVAANSLYHAVAAKGAVTLREGVIDTAIRLLKAERSEKGLDVQPVTRFIVDHPMSDGDLANALTQDNGWITPQPPPVELGAGRLNPGYFPFRPGDTERAHNAQELTLRLVATQLGRPLDIYRAGSTKAIRYTPFSGQIKGGPIALNEKLETDEETGVERSTFTQRKT